MSEYSIYLKEIDESYMNSDLKDDLKDVVTHRIGSL